MEGPLDAARPIRISHLVGTEGKAVPLREGLHLGDRDHGSARPLEHDHVGVVDHHDGTRPAEVLERLGQKRLAVEALEARRALEEEHPRVAQHRGSGLHETLLAPEDRLMGRRVVLKLLARLEVVLPRRDIRRITDTGPPAEGRERRVGQLHPRGLELLMDPDQIARAGIEVLQDRLPVRLHPVRSVEGRRRDRVRLDDRSDHPA